MNDSMRRTLFVGLPAILFVVGAVLGWIGHGALSPAGKVPGISVYSNWRLGCPALSDAKGNCTMQLPVLDQQSGSCAFFAFASDAISLSSTGMAETQPAAMQVS